MLKREALSLRTFFDEQIDYMHNLISSLNNYIYDEIQQTTEDKQIVENFVDASNSKMRAVQGYSDKLRVYVRTLYSHVLQVADEIPPPIDLNLETFQIDTLVNALFVNSQDIDRLFDKNPDVNAFLHSNDKNQAPILYALLTASKTEKITLGLGMQGDMIIRDLPQQVVNFSEHKIHTPCASSEELNTALKEYLFNRVVDLIRQEMNAQLHHQAFNSSDNSYEAKVNSLANPDVYLDTLIKYIEKPTELLGIDKIHLKLSKFGIKLEDDDQQRANEIDIHELVWLDNIRIVVLQIARTR